ncbi:MAG: TatD family hydrolase, partial [Simkaniaceae bacterium]|nr:TatD family hydrolase [Simkaniaceae bacterium]
MIIDSHAHLTCDAIYPDVEVILQRAKDAGISHIFNICTDAPTLERGIELAKKHPWIHNVGATTPHDVTEEGEKNFSLFESAAKNGKLVAVGETGLDYYYEHSPKDLQKTYFEKYLALADETNLPVVIHCRDAFDDLFAIAKGVPSLLLHCFTGTVDEAMRAVEQGWMVSLSGITTFKRSEQLRDVAREVPLSNLFVETDTPYLAPQSKRGKQNEPAFVLETIE